MGPGRSRHPDRHHRRWTRSLGPRRPPPSARRHQAAAGTRGRSKQLGAPRMPPAAPPGRTSAPAAAGSPRTSRGWGGWQFRVVLRSRRPRRAAPLLVGAQGLPRQPYAPGAASPHLIQRSQVEGSDTTTPRPAPNRTGPGGPASSGEPSSPAPRTRPGVLAPPPAVMQAQARRRDRSTTLRGGTTVVVVSTTATVKRYDGKTA